MVRMMHANNDCDQKLPEAETQYLEGYYDVTIQLLDECLTQNGFSDNHRKIEAYSILTRAYMAGDYPIEKTEAAINRILDLDSNYQPNTPENTKFEDSVNAEKERRRQIANARKKRNWIVGGTAVFGIGILIYVFTRPGKEPDLPGPPALP
jgi:hypothetical protein